MPVARPDDLTDLAALGRTVAEGKQLVAGVQREIVAAQARPHAARRPECRGCVAARRVKDYRHHPIATLFGQVAVRLPRFRCAAWATTETSVGWPPTLLGQNLPADASRAPRPCAATHSRAPIAAQAGTCSAGGEKRSGFCSSRRLHASIGRGATSAG